MGRRENLGTRLELHLNVVTWSCFHSNHLNVPFNVTLLPKPFGQDCSMQQLLLKTLCCLELHFLNSNCKRGTSTRACCRNCYLKFIWQIHIQRTQRYCFFSLFKFNTPTSNLARAWINSKLCIPRLILFGTQAVARWSPWIHINNRFFLLHHIIFKLHWK